MTLDPLSSVTTQVVGSATKAAEGLLGRLLGPAADELGLVLQEKVRAYRSRNTLRALDKAQALLLEARLEPKPVPLRTLIPLLDGASLEDDAFLNDLWARLLASAASGVEEIAHPSFAKILSEMSPLDARLLELLRDRCSSGDDVHWIAFRAGAAEALSQSLESINSSYGNLFRLGLCRIKANRTYRKAPETSDVELSPFGKRFLNAVRGSLQE